MAYLAHIHEVPLLFRTTKYCKALIDAVIKY